jgi:protein-disulfide isomerase
MKYIAAVIVFFTVLTTPIFAFEINAMTPEERDIFRQEVRAYLLERPEVLMEAIAVLEQRQSTAEAVSDVELVAGNAGPLFADSNSFVGGNLEGDVTMVEFLDYRCGFCRRAHPEVAELIKSDGNIRYIIKEFPILGEESMLASRFAISVLQNSDPETYFAASNALMTFRGKIDSSSLSRLATQLNLDAEQILAGMESHAVSSVIAENRALAQQLNINGTPGFVFGNQMVRGYLPLNDMQQMVADIRLASR